MSTHMCKICPGILHSSLSPPNSPLDDYLPLMGEETEAEISHFPRTLAYQALPQHSNHCSLSFIWREASQPQFSLPGSCFIHKAAALSKLVSPGHSPGLSGHHLNASSAGHFVPLETMAFTQRVPAELSEDKPLAPNLASGCPQTSHRDSLAVAARSIWKHPLFYCYGKARRGDCRAVSPTPRASQKSRCTIWDFPVSSLWLGACPPHLVGWRGGDA